MKRAFSHITYYSKTSEVFEKALGCLPNSPLHSCLK